MSVHSKMQLYKKLFLLKTRLKTEFESLKQSLKLSYIVCSATSNTRRPHDEIPAMTMSVWNVTLIILRDKLKHQSCLKRKRARHGMWVYTLCIKRKQGHLFAATIPWESDCTQRMQSAFITTVAQYTKASQLATGRRENCHSGIY